MRRPLDLVYEDREDLRLALEGDLAKAGAFVACDDPPPFQERVVVAVRLAFENERVLLDADVVHVVTADRAPLPDAVGVGVQFLETPEQLAARFVPFLDDESATTPEMVPESEPAPAEVAEDPFGDGDLFGDEPERGAGKPARDAEPDLSDAELANLLEGKDDEFDPEALGGGAEAAAGEQHVALRDDAIDLENAPDVASEAASGEALDWLEPHGDGIDPTAEVETESAGSDSGSFDPSEVALEAGEEPIDLGEPGKGHRVRHDD